MLKKVLNRYFTIFTVFVACYVHLMWLCVVCSIVCLNIEIIIILLQLLFLFINLSSTGNAANLHIKHSRYKIYAHNISAKTTSFQRTTFQLWRLVNSTSFCGSGENEHMATGKTNQAHENCVSAFAPREYDRNENKWACCVCARYNFTIEFKWNGAQTMA